MRDIWPYVSNPEAIAVNQRWAGDPGRLVTINDKKSLIASSNLQQGVPASPTPPRVEVWAKVQPGARMALFVINTDATQHSPTFNLDLRATWPSPSQNTFETMPPGWCGGDGAQSRCTVRDIWQQANAGMAINGVWHVPSLGPHDSAFVIVGPP